MVVGRALPDKTFADVREAVMDQMPHERIRGPVERQPALVAACDEAHPSEQGELMARDGQREIERASEVPNGQLVVRERVHERDSDWIREDFEYLYGPTEYLGRCEPVLRRFDLLAIDDFGQRVLDGHSHS